VRSVGGRTPSSSGRLQPGATIPLSDSSTYPSTERTLSSLSTIANGGGLGQIGDIIHNFSAAVSGREPEIRELLTRLDDFVGVLDEQRDNIVASIQQLDRVAGTFAGQRDVIDRALKEIPPALDVLIRERPTLTTALEKLGQFGDTAAGLVNDAGDDLVTDLKNLEPALKALADVGPDLAKALIFATAFPYGPGFADGITRGDYINLVAVFDLTYPRLKRTLLAGTRWGDENAKLIPAPGDPYYLNYSYSPMSIGVAPPPDQAIPPATGPTGEPIAAGRPVAAFSADDVVTDLRRAVRRQSVAATCPPSSPSRRTPRPGRWRLNAFSHWAPARAWRVTPGHESETGTHSRAPRRRHSAHTTLRVAVRSCPAVTSHCRRPGIGSQRRSFIEGPARLPGPRP
jgi:hypothetical protein